MQLELDDGVLLNYETQGDPNHPTVLLWHGARCTLRQWDHVVRDLAGKFHVVRFDVRGAGQSAPGPDKGYTLQTYAEDACALLNHVHVDQCHIWSMAWGSRAAFAFCAYYPGRVRRAALFDLSIGKADVSAQREGTRQARAKQRAAGYEPPPLPTGWNDHLDEAALEKSLSAAGRIDLGDLTSKLTMPILVATGDHDPNLASSKDVVQRLPDGRLTILQDVGHGSVLMQPKLCTEVVLEFLSSNDHPPQT
jgi:pimeloyl-ACP methyl ester carboxylesterase